MSKSITKISIPTPICQPLFPVKHGSVLSQLIESRNTSSSRCPIIISGFSESPTQDHKRKDSLHPEKHARPCSRIPKPMSTVQGRAFEKSLRSYCRSSPGTPSSLSRASSPTKFSTRSNSSRAGSPTPSGARISSFRSTPNKRQTLSLDKTLQNRPPPSPRGCQQSINVPSAKQIIYEPRPVRLAYGINGPQYKASQKMAADIANNNCRNRKNCGLTPGDRMTRKLVTDAENQRSNRMLHSAVAQIEMKPVQICTPVTENGVVLCPCEHEERACQTISSEMLYKKRFDNTEDKNKAEIARSQSGESQASSQILTDEINSRLKERDTECQKLQGIVHDLQMALDDLSTRNEMLEVQLFECKEKIEETRSTADNPKEQHIPRMDLNNMDSTATHSSLIPTTDAGVETDKDIFQTQLKFALETFLFAQIKSSSTVEGGDSATIGSDDENNNAPHAKSKKLKMTQLALSVRDALLNEIRIKLRKAYTILQQRCEPLLEPMGGEDSKTVLLKKYQDILPPEVGEAFHSYRKFVRFIHTYVDQSLAEIREFDGKVFNLDSNYDCIPLVSVDTIVEVKCNQNYEKFETNADTENNDQVWKGDEENEVQEPELSKQSETLVLFMSSKSGDDEDLCNDPGQEDTQNTPTPAVTLSMDSSSCSTVILLVTPLPDSKLDPLESPCPKPAQRVSVLEWFTTPEKEVVVPESPKMSPLAAARQWLDRTQSPLTTFILKPISITKLFDPVHNPECVQLPYEVEMAASPEEAGEQSEEDTITKSFAFLEQSHSRSDTIFV